MCKTANLLADGHDSPPRVGLLLDLHWQSVCLLLGAVASGATAVVASDAAELAGFPVAFVRADAAQAALEAGVEDVLAVSGHPLGARLRDVPALVLDAAAEIPSYGDHWAGPVPAAASVELQGVPVTVPDLGLTADDRVMTALPFDSAAGLGTLLSALRAGASLVLVRGDADLAAITAAERVTRTITA